MDDVNKLWESAVAEIELSVSKANFSTWFKQTNIVREEAGVAYLSVPNEFVRNWLATKYHLSILKSLRNVSPSIKGVDYLISRDEKPERQESRVSERGDGCFGEQMKFNDLFISTEDNLNPKYTFDAFVVGPFNELAHAAAQAVVRNPGSAYNPLFIYGGTGLGKTHLIQSIGNHIKKVGQGRKIYYTTFERYATEVVDSIQNNRMIGFKEKYRKYDLLIVDDIQFITGKEKSQEELFHLFNYLYEKNRQIIFSSDKPPKDIAGIEERLRSRFEGGMMVDISKPEFESRLAILKSKLKASHFAPGDSVIEYIASVVQDNIRELEGVLNSIVCQSQLKARDLTEVEIKTLIKNHTKPQKIVSVKDVIKSVATFYHIEERMLYEKTRRREVVKPRQIVMYLLREDFNTSYPFIGQRLGGRDHTTVIHAYEKIKGDLKTDALLSQELDQIKTMLYQSLAPA